MAGRRDAASAGGNGAGDEAMNRPDKAGEPSMEEILASIRQIISDDPATGVPVPAIEANPLVPQSAKGAAKPDPVPPAMPPPVDSLSGVLKNGPLPPTRPLGSKRPLPFDHDLADMLDEVDSGTSAGPAPKPDIRVPPELSAHPTSTANGEAKLNGAAALPPQLAVPTPSVPPPPFGAAPAASETPAPRTFGFPPLRKASFYPPPTQPTLPPIGDAMPAAEGAGAAGPARVEEALKRISDFGSLVPGEVGVGASTAAGPLPAPVREAAADAPAVPDLALSVEPGVRGFGARDPLPTPTSLPTPALTPAPALTPTPSPQATIPVAAAIAEPVSEPVVLAPAAPEPVSVPEAVSVAVPAPSATPAVVVPDLAAVLPVVDVQPADAAPQPAAAAPAAVEPDPSVVAAQALDALAQGLAASAAASALGAAASQQPLIALKPVLDPPDARPGPAPSPPHGAAPPTAGRTLEDAVADMLRPMLQQWVADNMPRIIERALRVEVAKTVKPGPNSSGS